MDLKECGKHRENQYLILHRAQCGKHAHIKSKGLDVEKKALQNVAFQFYYSFIRYI